MRLLYFICVLQTAVFGSVVVITTAHGQILLWPLIFLVPAFLFMLLLHVKLNWAKRHLVYSDFYKVAAYLKSYMFPILFVFSLCICVFYLLISNYISDKTTPLTTAIVFSFIITLVSVFCTRVYVNDIQLNGRWDTNFLTTIIRLTKAFVEVAVVPTIVLIIMWVA